MLLSGVKNQAILCLSSFDHHPTGDWGRRDRRGTFWTAGGRRRTCPPGPLAASASFSATIEAAWVNRRRKRRLNRSCGGLGSRLRRGRCLLTTPQQMSRSSFKCLFISLGEAEEWGLGSGGGRGPLRTSSDPLVLYLRRSSCFIRLCFSLCSPSVTLYISLQAQTQHLLQTHVLQTQLELGAVHAR